MAIESPQISLIMGVYKEPLPWITQSINSILNQTYRDFEFLIVNDNPDDKELRLFLEQYQENDSRLKIIANEQNIGLTKSLNKALDKARGRYIARMDADDISHKDRLKIQFDYMESHPEVDLCGTWGSSFGNISKFSLRTRKMPITDSEIKACLIFKNPFIHSSVFFKKVINKKEVKYNESAKRSQDYMLWYELSLINAIFHNIKKPLVKYRLSSLQITNNHNSEQILVSSKIRELLLKKINNQITEEDIMTHIAICTNNNKEISVENKIAYLNKLNEWCKRDNKYYYYRAWCAKFSLSVCMEEKDFLQIPKISFLKLSDILDIGFLWSIIRNIVR